MQKKQMISYIFALTAIMCVCTDSLGRLQGGSVSEETAASAVNMAAVCPAFDRLPAGAKLVDFIDCSQPPAERGFADDGRSSVVTTSTGNYRQSDINDNSFFAYRFAIGQIKKLHIIVVEYPDDDERTAAIFLHESKMRGTYNSDFHIEGGYSTGAEYPNTGKMQQQLIYYWPEEKSPAIVCMTAHHQKAAAMSRIWVYEITEQLTPAKINLPDKKYPQRQIGIFFEDSRMFRYNFGRGGNGYENCAQYLSHTGQNLLSFDVMLYSHPKCDIPALSKKNADTKKALEQCDKYGLDFLAVFDPTSSASVNGLKTGELEDDAVIDAWADAFGQFVNIYGSHKSLKGVAFGGPAGANRFKSPKLPELQKKINDKIKSSTHSDIVQHIFFGYHMLHRFMFLEPEYQSRSIMQKWLDTAMDGHSFKSVLTKYVDKYYKDIHLNLEDYTSLANTIIHRSFYVNDQRCFRFYPFRTPLWMIFRDFNYSREASRLLDSPKTLGACLFGNYFEVTVPLFKDKNFWWDRTWVASQINPSTSYFLETYTNALASSDATFILNSSWVNPVIGSADLVRNFAAAFRTLPAIKFDTAFVSNHVITRQKHIDGDLWFYLLNNHHTPAKAYVEFGTLSGEITNLVTGEKIKPAQSLTKMLKPYELACFRIDNFDYELLNSSAARVKGSYAALAKRIDDLDSSIRKLQQASKTVEPAFIDLRKQVTSMFRAQRYDQADDMLGFTANNELALRVQLSEMESFSIKPAETDISIDGDLNEWKNANSISINESKYLVCDHWLFNYWEGEDDLSATIWAAYDKQNLYLAFDVKDNVNMNFDGIMFNFDTDNFASTANPVGPALTLAVNAPGEAGPKVNDSQAVVQTDYGYKGEMVIPLSRIGAVKGREFGFRATLTDMDMPTERFQALIRRRSWRREKRMGWPVNPNYLPARQAQSCGKMLLLEQ